TDSFYNFSSFSVWSRMASSEGGKVPMVLMMSALFQEAAKHLQSKQVELLKESSVLHQHYFFKTGSYDQRFWYEKSKLRFNCTCKYGSLQGATYQVICSHTLACLHILVEEARLTGGYRG
ncbi:MAG: hypothetical protein ACE5H1_02410, partial [Thermodesulfobacteriota bacterium]